MAGASLAMMTFRYLPPPRIQEIFTAFRDAELVRSRILDSLLEGIDPGFVGSLPDDGPANARLLTTLHRLNGVERITDGTVPFVLWLDNAASLATAFPNAAAVLSRALADVSARASRTAPEPGYRPALPTKDEKIVHQDDMLPFSFLRRGVEAGYAVARLVVTRYEDGQPALDAAGRPRRYLGTGWLLTRSLLITNHHVINARNADEPNAQLRDLELQAKSVVAQFDYDEPAAAFTEVHAAALEAFSPCDGSLDYTIVRLGAPVDRRPLPVSRSPLTLPPNPDRYPAVNIIQHPEGSPKRVACRNNLVIRIQGSDIWYFTDTMYGSSGSPVLDDQWQVIALHKKWDFIDNVMYQGKTTAWANVGTLISAVLDDLARSSEATQALCAEILRDNKGG